MKTALYIFPALIAAITLFMVVQNFRTPSGLGVADGRLAPVPGSPNAVSSQADDPEKKVAPIPFSGSLEQTRALVKKALEAHGNIEIKQEDRDYIHAVSTSPRMRFKDDLEFYFNETERLVHFRSASRVGYSDLGVNRARYDRLAALLAKAD